MEHGVTARERQESGMGVRGKGRRLSPLPCSLHTEQGASALAGVEGGCHSQHTPKGGRLSNVARKGISDAVSLRTVNGSVVSATANHR